MTEAVAGEPVDGWATSSLTLIDTELMMTTLCRFTGYPTSHHDPCAGRVNLQHPDVECRSLFVRADALSTDELRLEAFDEIPEEVRRPWRGGTPTATSHER